MPEQFFEFVFNVTIVPEHLLRAVPPAELRTASLARQPVGSGPFRFVRWDAGQRIELIADTTHRDGRPSLDRLIFSIAADAQTASAQLLSGQADFHEIVTGDNVQAVQQHPDLKVIPYTSLQYGYVGFNLRDPGTGTRPHPIFADRSVRRALTMALDRQAMVRNVFDTLAMVPIGPTVRTLAAPDTNLSQIPHDLEGARRMLDSLGWRDTNGDGIRERNGRPLRFSLSFPTSSRPRARFAVLIQEQLKQAGVQVDLEPLEFNVWATRHREGKFDTVIGAWIADPSPGSIRQTWTSAGLRGRGGSNHSSYQNPVFDALVDSAVAEFDAAKSKRHLLRAYQVIIDDAPAIWLYEPRLVAGAHKRLRVTGMRIDAWWAGIPRWSIPPGERIARDRIGLRPQAE